MPRRRAIGPRSTGIIWDLLGPDVGTRTVMILADVSLRVAGSLSRDTDGQLLVSAAREISADSRIAVSGVVEKNADAAVRVSARLVSQRDAMLRVFGAAVRIADARLAVANTVESLTDFLVRVAGARQIQTDAVLTVIGLLDRSADVYLEITDAGLVRADTQLVVTRPVTLVVDNELLVLQRLVPDLATEQTIYAVLIRESHPIQV